MKVQDLDKYLGSEVLIFHPEKIKTVAVKMDDGQIFRGRIRGYTSEFDSSSGKDEIDLFTGEVEYGLPIDEIISVTELG